MVTNTRILTTNLNIKKEVVMTTTVRKEDMKILHLKRRRTIPLRLPLYPLRVSELSLTAPIASIMFTFTRHSTKGSRHASSAPPWSSTKTSIIGAASIPSCAPTHHPSCEPSTAH